MEEDDDDEGNQYEVEAIVDAGIDQDTKQHMYFVKWKGYSAEENTWEPKQNLVGCEQMIQDYDKKNKSKNREQQPAAKRGRGRPPKSS